MALEDYIIPHHMDEKIKKKVEKLIAKQDHGLATYIVAIGKKFGKKIKVQHCPNKKTIERTLSFIQGNLGLDNYDFYVLTPSKQTIFDLEGEMKQEELRKAGVLTQQDISVQKQEKKKEEEPVFSQAEADAWMTKIWEYEKRKGLKPTLFYLFRKGEPEEGFMIQSKPKEDEKIRPIGRYNAKSLFDYLNENEGEFYLITIIKKEGKLVPRPLKLSKFYRFMLNYGEDKKETNSSDQEV